MYYCTFFWPSSLSNASWMLCHLFEHLGINVYRSSFTISYMSHNLSSAKTWVWHVTFYLFAYDQQYCCIMLCCRYFLEIQQKGVNKTLHACDPQITHRFTRCFPFSMTITEHFTLLIFHLIHIFLSNSLCC